MGTEWTQIAELKVGNLLPSTTHIVHLESFDYRNMQGEPGEEQMVELLTAGRGGITGEEL